MCKSKKFLYQKFVLLILTSLLYQFSCKNENSKDRNTEISKVFFSPHGGAEQAIVQEINNARDSILVAAYAFNSKNIISALKNALGRGLELTFILDYEFNVKNSMNTFEDIVKTFRKSEIYVNKNHISKQHNKFMIIDDKVLLTGSYNFTNAAEHKNLENLFVTNNKKVLNLYKEEFERMKNIDTFIIDVAWLNSEKRKLKEKKVEKNKK